MKALVQRVLKASVSVGDEIISSIGPGLCVFIGISRKDGPKDAEFLARKLLNLRVFEEGDGKRWDKNVMEKHFEILCVSQFTLQCTLKGYKPDFHNAMNADDSEQFYENFIQQLREGYSEEKIKDGRFGAMMQVNITNDGPVTIPIETPLNIQQVDPDDPQIEAAFREAAKEIGIDIDSDADPVRDGIMAILDDAGEKRGKKSRRKSKPTYRVIGEVAINLDENDDDDGGDTVDEEGNKCRTVKPEELRKRGETKYWSRTKIPGSNGRHKCMECSVVVRSRKRLNEHMKRVHEKKYRCDVCERGFGYPTDLARHKCQGKPDPDNPTGPRRGGVPQFLPCNECEYIGTSKRRLNEHVRRKHRLRFKCEKCDKAFGFVKDLQRHKIVHEGPAHFCDKCERFYRSKKVYDMHLKTHEDGYIKPTYPCQVCTKTFASKYVLAAHIKTEHLGIKKNKSTLAPASMKPYLADMSEKTFAYDKYMSESNRRFQCRLCGKAFRQTTTLRIHMKVHQTVQDSDLETFGLVARKQPYSCRHCQKTFGYRSTIRGHMIRHHGKTEENWKEDVISSLKKKAPKDPNKKRKRNRKKEGKQPQSVPQHPDLNQLQQQLERPYIPNGMVATQQMNQNNMFSCQQQSSTMPINYSIPPPQNQPDYSNMSNSQDHMDGQTLASSFQQQQQPPHREIHPAHTSHTSHSSNLFQPPTLVPLPSATDRINPQRQLTTDTPTSDSVLGQAMASIWGFVGYPAYYNNPR